jgi:hypothetical protein
LGAYMDGALADGADIDLRAQVFLAMVEQAYRHDE